MLGSPADSDGFVDRGRVAGGSSVSDMGISCREREGIVTGVVSESGCSPVTNGRQARRTMCLSYVL